MARARNIKPSFFQNEELGELTPIERLAFIGLWTLSDFKGCIEYRPKRIKVQILPYDDCNIEQVMQNLARSGFIAIYTVQGQRYIKVINFTKHQNPHKNEREGGSDLPDEAERDDSDGGKAQIMNGLPQTLDQNGTARESVGTTRADSLNLIPDSPTLIPQSVESPVAQDMADGLNISFDDFWGLYDKKVNVKTCMAKWKRLTNREREQAMAHIPKYIQAQPDKSYRKNPETYLNHKSWGDEIIPSGGGKPAHAKSGVAWDFDQYLKPTIRTVGEGGEFAAAGHGGGLIHAH